MVQDVTSILVAAAAVIGLVPLGVASIHKMIKSRRQKKNSEWLGTVAVSVFLSLIAPGVLESGSRHLAAINDAMPDWLKAAIPPPSAGAPVASANGSSPAPNQQTPTS